MCTFGYCSLIISYLTEIQMVIYYKLYTYYPVLSYIHSLQCYYYGAKIEGVHDLMVIENF